MAEPSNFLWENRSESVIANYMKNIRNVIFDLGGVVMNFDFEGAGKMFKKLGITSAGGVADISQLSSYKKEVAKFINDFINGFINAEELAALLLPYCAKGVEVSHIRQGLKTLSGNLPAPRLEMLVKLRKAGYKVFLLSNINEEMWQQTVALISEQGYTVAECFDATFLSYSMHVAKPAPMIFSRMIAETAIDPAESLYFDDLAENIEAGSAAGLHSVLVKSNELENCESYKNITNAL